MPHMFVLTRKKYAGLVFFCFWLIYMINSRIGFLYGIISQVKSKDLFYVVNPNGYRGISAWGTLV